MSQPISVKMPAKKPGVKSPKALSAEEYEMRGRLRVEREFLEMVIRRGNKIRVPELFEGFTPVWAVAAGERVQASGRAVRDKDGKYTVTEAGVAWLATDAGR